MADLGFIAHCSRLATGRKSIDGIKEETLQVFIEGNNTLRTVIIQFDIEHTRIGEESTLQNDEVFLTLRKDDEGNPTNEILTTDEFHMDIDGDPEDRIINTNTEFYFLDGKIGGAGQLTPNRVPAEQNNGI